MGPVTIRRSRTNSREGWYTLPLTLVLASGVLAGCASSWRTLPPAAERLPRVATISLAPPRVAMYEAGPFPQLVPNWTEAARTNLARALAGEFTSTGPVVVRHLDPTRAPAAAQAVEALPLWRVDKYGVIHTIYARRPALPCLSGPTPALAEAAETDAVLLIYAVETVKTPGTAAGTAIAGAIHPGNWMLLPLWLATDPKGWAGYFWGGGHTAVQFCLVDPRTAEVLWFHLDESHSGRLLQDAAKVQALVSEAHLRFRRTFGVGR